jgi:hypothetical protein
LYKYGTLFSYKGKRIYGQWEQDGKENINFGSKKGYEQQDGDNNTKEIRNFYRHHNIITAIKSTTRWTGHVGNMKDTRNSVWENYGEKTTWINLAKMEGRIKKR